ncbi:hypothetical protein N7460_003214 [Penicillium canescens]|nr:hypothetical protein N7460_003214 [Penicillium canescens]KAJ6063204.1 hypothetical protein N7446_007324 [Penicillium canescens]
MCPVDTT